MSESIVTLEQNSRFSQSLLWQYQEDYFTRKGVNAWAQGEVPYYVTSNMLIAHSFAQLTVRYIQDCLRNGTIDPALPLYVFELGTGSGKFSYLYLKSITEALKHFHLDHLKFCYVMTDFTDSNLLYWQRQPRFQPFLDKNLLDFAIYKVDKKQDLTLTRQQITLSDGSCRNPIIVIGNYIFDTVRHDAFRITNGKIEEGLITTKTPADNVVDKSVQSLDRLQSDFSFKEISLPYYNNEYLDKILAGYCNSIVDSTILIPIGGLTCIDNLRRLCNNRMLLITSDKGYASLENIKNLGTPHIAFHGSFSMMVNYDCISSYVTSIGGDVLTAEDHEGMKTSVFCLGNKFSELPETAWANEEYSIHISTKEFLDIKNFLIKDISQLDSDDALSLMKFSYWDPDIFYSIAGQVVNLLPQASPGYIRTWRKGLALIADNYYNMKTYKNVPFELAHVYQVIGDLDEALKFYQQTIDNFGDESPIRFNMGLCYYYKRELKTALDCFYKALELNPENKGAREWIGFVNKELQEQGVATGG